jgi:RNA polymerase sigma-70 factor, ECF subfamily
MDFGDRLNKTMQSQTPSLSIVRYIFRRLPEGSMPEDAADIAAEVFTTAWRDFGHVPAPPEDKLWLYGVA